MKLTARYTEGALVLDRPIRLKRDVVQIDIPDEELMADSGPPAPAQATGAWEEWQLEAMRKMPWLREIWEMIRNPPQNEPGDGELTERQKERIAAFELRADYRKERGRSL